MAGGFFYAATGTQAVHTAALAALPAQIAADGYNSAIIQGASVLFQNACVQLQNMANALPALSRPSNVATQVYTLNVAGSVINDSVQVTMSVVNTPNLISP